MSVGLLKALTAKRHSKDPDMEALFKLCREAELKIEALNRQAEQRRTDRQNQEAHQ